MRESRACALVSHCGRAPRDNWDAGFYVIVLKGKFQNFLSWTQCHAPLTTPAQRERCVLHMRLIHVKVSA